MHFLQFLLRFSWFSFSAVFDLEEIEAKILKLENPSSIPLTLIIDNVRTPDNIGALIRVGAAVGCEKIITTKVNRFWPIFIYEIDILLTLTEFLSILKRFFDRRSDSRTINSLFSKLILDDFWLIFIDNQRYISDFNGF